MEPCRKNNTSQTINNPIMYSIERLIHDQRKNQPATKFLEYETHLITTTKSYNSFTFSNRITIIAGYTLCEVSQSICSTEATSDTATLEKRSLFAECTLHILRKDFTSNLYRSLGPSPFLTTISAPKLIQLTALHWYSTKGNTMKSEMFEATVVHSQTPGERKRNLLAKTKSACENKNNVMV